MNNNSVTKKSLSQVISMVLGAAILTTLTQRSFDSIGTKTDEVVSNFLNSKPSLEINGNQQASN